MKNVRMNISYFRFISLNFKMPCEIATFNDFFVWGIRNKVNAVNLREPSKQKVIFIRDLIVTLDYFDLNNT